MLEKMKAEIKLIDEVLNEAFKGSPKEVVIPAQHLIKQGGKRIRPLMCLLACEACQGKPKDALKVACGVELIHTFTLVHDDIMDQDLLRRGMPSVHALYGEALAINAGDFLFAKAFETALDGLPVQKARDVALILAEASRKVAEGQALDLIFSKFTNVREGDYMKMIELKTSSLLEAAVVGGAVIAGADKKTKDALYRYAMLMGQAFQIQDDLLGIIGNQKELGKPVGSDIIEAKRTLMVVKTFEQPDLMLELMEILGNTEATEKEIKKAVEVMERSGSIDYAKKKAEELKKQALDQLKVLKDSRAKKLLIELTEFLTKRKY